MPISDVLTAIVKQRLPCAETIMLVLSLRDAGLTDAGRLGAVGPWLGDHLQSCGKCRRCLRGLHVAAGAWLASLPPDPI